MVYAFYTAIVLLLLCFVRKKPNNADTVIFTKNDTLCLKGISAVFVLLHHLGQYFEIPDPIQFNGYMGGMAVGIFFLLSAYGLTKANQKKGYYKRIFRQKIPALYVYQVLMNTLYYCLFFTEECGSVGEVLIRIFNFDFLFGYERLNGFSWFITSILVVYACYGGLAYVWEKVGEKCKNQRFWFAVICTAIIAVLYVLALATPIKTLYGRSIFCFALGVWVALFEKEILQFMRARKRYFMTCIGATALLLLCFFLLPEQFVCIATCVFVTVFFIGFSYPRSPIFEFLGKISLEIYLVQAIFFTIMPFEREWRDGVPVFALVLESAFVLYMLVKGIKLLIARLKSKANKKKA